MCTGCKQEKPIAEFSWKSRARGIRHYACKECHRRLRQAWYRRHRHEHIARVTERKHQVRAAGKLYILEYLSTHPCENCGEKDPVVLEFHHNNDSVKLKEVPQLVHFGYSMRRVKEELAKCSVLCANCHRRLTAKHQEWYKATLSK